MAKRGTLLGELEEAWRAFWRARWAIKGPVLVLIAAFILPGIITSAIGNKDDELPLDASGDRSSSTVAQPAAMTETLEPIMTPESTNTPRPTHTPVPTPDLTATAIVLESYKESPPPGEFRKSGPIGIVIWEVRYLANIGSFYANANSKFIVLNVSVGVSRNVAATFFGPTQFTLVSTMGHTIDIDSSTYLFNAPFPSLTVQPGDSTGGVLVFLVGKDFIPGRLVWDGFGQTVAVPIVQD